MCSGRILHESKMQSHSKRGPRIQTPPAAHDPVLRTLICNRSCRWHLPKVWGFNHMNKTVCWPAAMKMLPSAPAVPQVLTTLTHARVPTSPSADHGLAELQQQLEAVSFSSKGSGLLASGTGLSSLSMAANPKAGTPTTSTHDVMLCKVAPARQRTELHTWHDMK